MQTMNNSVQKLINKFIVSNRNYYDAILAGNWRKANAPVKQFHKIFLEITKYGNIGRDALLKEAESSDPIVAVAVAAYSLKYYPEKSLAVLFKLSSREGLIGLEAEQAIKRWNEGNWHLE
jgi:hypothetical protein